MWVRSQDKKELVKCISFSATNNLGGKKRGVVMGVTARGFWGAHSVVLGFYDSAEEAKEELTNIQNALRSDLQVYEMK